MFSLRAPAGNATISMVGANVGVGLQNPQASLDVSGLLQTSTQLSFSSTSSGNVALGALGNASADRIVLWPGNASSYAYTVGVQGNTMYSSVPTASWHELLVGGQTVLASGPAGLSVPSISTPGAVTAASLSAPGVCNVGTMSVTGNLSVGGTLALANLALSNVTVNVLTGNSVKLPNAAAFTGNEADLGGRLFVGSYVAAAQGVAPVMGNIKVYSGTAPCVSGAATFYPTSNGLANGTAIFANIASVQASVQATVLVNTAAANAVAYAGVRSISATTVIVNAISPTGTVTTTTGAGREHDVLHRAGPQRLSRVRHDHRHVIRTHDGVSRCAPVWGAGAGSSSGATPGIVWVADRRMGTPYTADTSEPSAFRKYMLVKAEVEADEGHRQEVQRMRERARVLREAGVQRCKEADAARRGVYGAIIQRAGTASDHDELNRARVLHTEGVADMREASSLRRLANERPPHLQAAYEEWLGMRAAR